MNNPEGSGDRQKRGGERRRRRRGSRWAPYRLTRQSIGGYLFSALALIAVILYTAVRINPIFLGGGSMMQQLVIRPTTVISVPQGDLRRVLGDSVEFAALTAEPGFLRD